MARRKRVLIVEDDFTVATAFALALPCVDTEIVGTCAAARERVMKSPKIEGMILDIGLPNSQGVATVEVFQRACPWIAMLVVTGLDDVQLGSEELIVAGAQDVMRKPGALADPATLRRTLFLCMARHQVRSEFRAAREEVQGGKEEAEAKLVSNEIAAGKALEQEKADAHAQDSWHAMTERKSEPPVRGKP